MIFKFVKNNNKELDFPGFVELVEQKKNGVTTGMDDCYLSKTIRTYPEARQWYRLIKESYPEARMGITCKNKILVNCGIVLAVILVSITGYAIFRTLEKTDAKKGNNHGFYQVRMEEVIAAAQKVYNEKMILDQPELGEERCSGVLDPKVPLEKFLNNLKLINNLEYYHDSAEVIHLRKKEDS